MNSGKARSAANDLTIQDDSDLLATLLERQELFEKLVKIQRSISHGAPLQEVFDAITQGAAELFGDDEVVGLRIIDDDPEFCRIVSAYGVNSEMLNKIERTQVGIGAGGQAILENRLVVIEDYSADPKTIPQFAREGLKTAMAAPVHDKGEVAGSLVVASYQDGRVYTDSEQDALLTFAQHASLALSDARAVEAMRQAQRSKEMFTAMVSHALKTPLTAIMGALLVLEKHHERMEGDKREQMVRNARHRTEDLGRIVSRLLQQARAELAPVPTNVRLSDLIEDSVRGFEHNREIRVGDIPSLEIHVDADAVYEVIGIFLENAISHSPEDAVVGIHTELRNADVVVSVSNPGELPEGMHEARFFEPFTRGDGGGPPGVGLGLYIAAQLATALRGKIEISSDKGTVTFSLRFPVDPAQ